MPTKGKLPELAKPEGAAPEAPRRPSEPRLDVLPRPTKRPSEPRPDVLPKPATTKRSSEPRLDVLPKPTPAKPKLAEPTKGKFPVEWRKLVDKLLTCSWRRSAGHLIEVIDWTKLPERAAWLARVFGDCDPSKHFVGLLSNKSGAMEWVSGTMLPVAMLGQQHGGEGQLEAVLLIDTTTADSPIYAIEVDGSAIPARKPQQVAANLAALEIQIVKADSTAKKLDFDLVRPKLISGKIDNDARKILQKLSGDRDAGASYLQSHITRKPKPPEGRDPRWIDALRDELAKSIVFASDSLQTETHFFAGTLASFGEPAVPALVAALETALASYPKQKLDYGVQPVLLALDYLSSDAGVSPALTILAKAKHPETSHAIPPALDYLKPRASDPRVAPVIKKLYKKAASKKPMHYIDDLEALAKQLDVA